MTDRNHVLRPGRRRGGACPSRPVVPCPRRNNAAQSSRSFARPSGLLRMTRRGAGLLLTAGMFLMASSVLAAESARPVMLRDVGIDQRLGAAASLRRDLRGRGGQAGPARPVLRQAAGPAGARLLQLPDALHAGLQRAGVLAARSPLRCGQGLRRRGRQLRSARPASRRGGQEEGLRGGVPPPRRVGGLALPDGRRGVDRAGDEGRGIPLPLRREHRASSRTPPRSTSRRRTGSSPAISTASSTARATCAWRWSRRRKGGSARSWTRSSSSASTTTRRWAATARPSCPSSGFGGVAAVLILSTFLIVMWRRDRLAATRIQNPKSKIRVERGGSR